MSFRGRRTLQLPPPSVSAYLSLRGGEEGGLPELGRLGEWMPSSASGGNDQSFISFLQCQSLQPSILRPAIAASSALVGLMSRRVGDRWAGHRGAAPFMPRLSMYFFYPFWQSEGRSWFWGAEPGLPGHHKVHTLRAGAHLFFSSVSPVSGT